MIRIAAVSRTSRSCPNIYPTRAETQILLARAERIRAVDRAGRAVVEFGSGSSGQDPAAAAVAIAPSAYVPLDIAGDFLRAALLTCQPNFPGLPGPISGRGDFMRRALELPHEVEGAAKRSAFSTDRTIGKCVARTATDFCCARCAINLGRGRAAADRHGP